MAGSSRSRGIAAATFVAVVAVIAIVVCTAPANWLALYVARQTHDVLLLADAQGTIWSGSAVVAIGAATEATAADARPATSDGNNPLPSSDRLALPGRVIWTLRWDGMLAPALHLTHDGVLLQPLAVHYVDRGWSVDAGAAVLPASLLRLAGAPLNTLMPDGRCELRWGAVRVDRDGVPVGEGTLRIVGLAMALSPVRPLGDYLATWTIDARGLTWQLATERGPLALEGNGTIGERHTQARVVARPAADAPPAVAAQLGPLLDMIGRRGSSEAVMQVGAS